MPERNEITSNIDLLLDTLPSRIRELIAQAEHPQEDLLEIVLDLGRLPEARYRVTATLLGDVEVTLSDIDAVTSAISAFGEDNRAGIPRTLHRISAIRNRSGRVIGLTCRIGRAVIGTISIIRDLVESGQSVLLLGRPGVGKTTMLRETARVLADDVRKRVVIVDTSNEIAGDGDIPHPGIGRARRMQVQRPSEQHAVMIEAVENHMPEVIVIDEIGTELEAQASRTIAERGVQLIGTAHGQLLENLMVNPTLSDLIGGIQAVTLGDDEARRRGTQKTVLERKQPPTFDVLVEIRNWDDVIVYINVAEAVDALLRGESPAAEQRNRTADGQISIEIVNPEPTDGLAGQQAWGIRRAHNIGMEPDTRNDRNERGFRNGRQGRNDRGQRVDPLTPASFAGPVAPRLSASSVPAPTSAAPTFVVAAVEKVATVTPTHRIYPFGLSRDKVEKAIAHLKVAAIVVKDINDANMVMTIKNYYRQGSSRLRNAEERNLPIYVLRSSTAMQIERQLLDIFFPDQIHRQPEKSQDKEEDVQEAILEAETAINQIINGERQQVELTPQGSIIRRLQHQMAERYNMQSESRGREPFRRVKLSR
ncbi:MAG: AAA family ATPase [Chloroflexia bacterium]|nr:AAA family ATPase [Chloroflexia bacterium]